MKEGLVTLSDEAKLVLSVAATVTVIVVVAVFLTALLVVEWRAAARKQRELQQGRIDGLVDEAVLKKLGKSAYTVDVYFYDVKNTRMHIECVCSHKLCNGILAVVQTDRSVTYVAMDTVEYVKALPVSRPEPRITVTKQEQEGENDVD